ncbi:hypothetical protein [Permianibacter aggregans]|uniref:hypothetical protein n=1 Tax=Permianibacter aggregans TaxID=1510150 RepID=UPI0012F9A0DE|nr:hypothetical protein [Permianibacter aggregans]
MPNPVYGQTIRENRNTARNGKINSARPLLHAKAVTLSVAAHRRLARFQHGSLERFAGNRYTDASASTKPDPDDPSIRTNSPPQLAAIDAHAGSRISAGFLQCPDGIPGGAGD